MVEQGSTLIVTAIRVSYTIGMATDVTFQLDPKGGEDVLQNLAMPVVKLAAEAIAQRATAMASSLSSDPPTITVNTTVGKIKRGQRAIGTISANGKDAHSNYIGHQALAKAKDAGRVN